MHIFLFNEICSAAAVEINVPNAYVLDFCRFAITNFSLYLFR